MKRNLAIDIALGAAAGAAATWLMDQATTVIQKHEPQSVQDREKEALGGRSAFENAAARGAEALLDAELDDDQRKQIGNALHWAIGISSGALYGALRHAIPMTYGSGLAFGTAVFLAVDEAANTLLGFTPPPDRFPWQTHARGLAGHAVLGGAIEAVFDAADAV